MVLRRQAKLSNEVYSMLNESARNKSEAAVQKARRRAFRQQLRKTFPPGTKVVRIISNPKQEWPQGQGPDLSRRLKARRPSSVQFLHSTNKRFVFNPNNVGGQRYNNTTPQFVEEDGQNNNIGDPVKERAEVRRCLKKEKVRFTYQYVSDLPNDPSLPGNRRVRMPLFPIVDLTIGELRRSGAIDPYKMNKLLSSLRIITLLLGASGLLQLIFICGLAINTALVDFLKTRFLANVGRFLFFLSGITHPVVVAGYCWFSLHHLKYLRCYLLRIPFTLILPFGLFILNSIYLSSIAGNTEPYLREFMQCYDKERRCKALVNGLQSLFSCCGIRSHEEWITTFHGQYPISCCRPPHVSNCSNSSVFHVGCLKSVTKINQIVALCMVLNSLLQLILLVLSLKYANKFHNLIKDRIEDLRPYWKIIFGKFCSLCESVKIYEQEEQLESLQRQERFEDFVDNLPVSSSSSWSMTRAIETGDDKIDNNK